MTTDPIALLRDAENYLSALHGSVAWHDNLAANLGCAGCELRDQIGAVLATPAAGLGVSATPSRTDLRQRIAEALIRWAYRGQEPDPETGILETVRANAYSRADAVLVVLYREWPWLRAEAEDATPPADRAAIRAEAFREAAVATRRGAFADTFDRMADAELRRLADEAQQQPTEPPACCAHCGTTILRVTGTLAEWWVHQPGGNTVCHPEQAANSTRAAPQPAATPRQDRAPGEEQRDEPWPVKESTLRYAEELRANPGTVSADGHTGWECDAGASLLVSARTPGPGALGTHHGTIYACTTHRSAAVERITAAGYGADAQPAPPGHRWNPWPCGHVTAHGAQALNGLTTAGAQQNEAVVTVHAVPLPGSNGISACCGRPPCEFVGERVTRDPDKVTCTGPTAGARQDGAQQDTDSPRTVCVCGHTRGEHLTVNGRLLCDTCDPDSTDNLVCRGFDAL